MMVLDTRFALRSFRLSPVFTVTAIATLALGIGGTTTIFSMVEAVLLRPLPYRAPDQLVQVWESKPSEGRERFEVSVANFLDWQTRATSFEALALFDVTSNRSVIGTSNGGLQVRDASVTPNLFPLLGVQPQMGRSFTTLADATGGALREVVIADHLWRNAFGTDPDIIGEQLRIEGRSSFVVVGVMPPGFSFPGETELWFAATTQSLRGTDRSGRYSSVIGRLEDGVSLATARADLELVSAQLAREFPATNQGWTVTMLPLQDAMVGHVRGALLTLFGAVSLVLLVVCTNVANLLLARGAGRERELTIRAALGATRRRIARLLLTESFLLSTLGGVLGWLLATATLPLLLHLAAGAIPRTTEAPLSNTALAFCALTSVATTFLIGLAPVATASRRDLLQGIQGDGERLVGSAGHTRLQLVFVTAEVAVTLVLLVGAVLFVQTLMQLRRVELGFRPEHVISLDVRVPFFAVPTSDRWYRLAEQSRALMARVRSIVAVEAAAMTSDPPLSGQQATTNVSIRRGNGEMPERAMALYHRVSSGYFATLAMSLVAGRDFTDEDASNESQLTSPRAAPREGAVIVNETMARRYWPEGNAIGQYLSTSFDRRSTSARRIVGIVRDVRSETLRGAPPVEVYVPYLEDPSFAFTLLVRTTLPLGTIVPTLRGEMRLLDPEISAAHVRTLDDIVTASLGSSRLDSFVVAVFAAFALLLSAVGIYGVLALTVARRTREIAIRVALGAEASAIRRLVLANTMKAVAAGVGLGVAGALAVTRLISNLLFGVRPTDPVSFAMAILLLVAVALLASYLPLRRALLMEPVVALRL